MAPERIGWTNNEELLAVLIEAVDVGNRMFQMVHAREGSKPPKPIHITRPGDQREPERKAMASPAEVMAFMEMTVEVRA